MTTDRLCVNMFFSHASSKILRTSIHRHKCDVHLLDEAPATSVLVAREDALQYYRSMQTMRSLALKARELHKQNIIRGPCHLYTGQEACAVGIEAAITDTDRLITAYRSHGFTFTRGGSLKEIIAEMAGRRTGISKGRGGPMHMFTKNFHGGYAIVGSQVSLGAGLALALKYRNTDDLSVCVYGDGAANQGQVAETMNMAALWKLPVIFACENNGYAKGTSVGRCTVNTDFYKRGDVIPGLRVDGMDVLSVREATRFASDHCRSGKVSFLFNKMEHLSLCRFISTCPFLVSQGPIIMELQTYRFFGHAIGDTEHKYRTADEVDKIRKERDPISLLEGHLIRNNMANMEELREINEKSVTDVEEASQFAIQSPEPLVEELCNYIYCNNPPLNIRGINPWTKLKSSM
ncbi:pyruvate dehydrogenase E1 component subunit alpha, mitochondrial-like isoform X2 [Nerophis ophidion]|uniref:pyruvate dehydrogenase E1 component subunit alpha, mitochondrial-like isoform X2 n=1 Tax=Nerophis ophidion TaxID=159077 RepID=UPI002AE05853|nr:pyruvate dehydrogenase E1 component subunit alpha, mitochondrial-like isoform X2 [Nerophis ophidion]